MSRVPADSAAVPAQRTKQINLETASRMQLIDFIRRMHPQLQREQERARELEAQISGFQAFIHEKNAEIRELRHQSDRLTEKSASDEETISALIRQVEGMRAEPSAASSIAPLSGAVAGQRRRTVEHGNGKTVSATEVVAGASEHAPDGPRMGDVAGGVEQSRRISRTPPPHRDNTDAVVSQLKSQNAAAAATIAGKADELAALESRVRELQEVNAFYFAIVSQHDQEEKVRMGNVMVHLHGLTEDDVAGLQAQVKQLQAQVAAMEEQAEKLQRVVSVAESDKAALQQENDALKREAVLLEAEMTEAAREHARARKALVAAAATASARNPAPHERSAVYPGSEAVAGRAGSAPHQSPTLEPPPPVPSRLAPPTMNTYSQQLDRRSSSHPTGHASRVSPLARDGRLGVGSAPFATQSSAVGTTSTTAPASSGFIFRSLRPMRVRNPDVHEKELLDRIHLYEEQFAQMEAYEADRQRSFDEMERNRAVLFVSMNSQLEKQRKEIHRLRKLHEEASLNSSVTARPSHNHSAASLSNREDEEWRGGSRRRGSRSPVEGCLTERPASSLSLNVADSTDGLDAADGATAGWGGEMRDSAIARDRHRRRGTVSASSPSASPNGAVAQLELALRESEVRWVMWAAAVEQRTSLFLDYHTSMVQQYARKLKLCEAEHQAEVDLLNQEADSLQTRALELEAKLASVLESGVGAGGVAQAAGAAGYLTMGTATAFAAADPCAEALAASLWEDKTMQTTSLALEVCGIAFAQYANLAVSSWIGEDGVARSDFESEGMQGDVDELHTTLKALRHQHRPPLARRSVLLPGPLHPSDGDGAEVTLQDAGTATALPLNASADTGDEAEVEREEVVSTSSEVRTLSPSSPPHSPLLSLGGGRRRSATASSESDGEDAAAEVAAVEQLPDVTASVATEEDQAPPCGPPHIFSREPAPESERVPSAPLPLLDVVSTDGGSEEAVTAAAARAASNRGEDGLAVAAAEGDGEEASRPAEQVPLRHTAFTPDDAHVPFRVEQQAADITASYGAARTHTPRHPSHATGVASVAEAAAPYDGDAKEEAVAGEEEEGEDGTISSTSQLEVTAGEEAEFLAQLEQEMLKGGLPVASAESDSDDTAAVEAVAAQEDVALLDSDTEAEAEGREDEQGEQLDTSDDGAASESGDGGATVRTAASVTTRGSGIVAEEQSGPSPRTDGADAGTVGAREQSDSAADAAPAAGCAVGSQHSEGPAETSPTFASSSSNTSLSSSYASAADGEAEGAIAPMPMPFNRTSALPVTAPTAPASSSWYNGNLRPDPASAPPRAAPSFSDAYPSNPLANLNAMPRPTAAQNTIFAPPAPTQQSTSRSYFPVTPSPSSARGAKRSSSQESSSDEFEAGFDPFA